MIKVAITGPESSGKTSLTQALSKHFGVEEIPEFSRLYLEKKGPNYQEHDLDKIAIGQRKLIDKSQDSIKIVDSDFLVLKIWSEYRYKRCSSTIQGLVKESIFDLHILCSPDIPWEYDELRENPNDRFELFERYKEELNKAKKNYIIVEGNHDGRLKKSIESISALLN